MGRGQDIPRLTFAQLVDSIRANPAVTRPYHVATRARRSRSRGSSSPLGPPDLSFFLLSRVSAVGNYCCEMPSGQDETVYVYAAKGHDDRLRPARRVPVRGVFEAGHSVDTGYGVSMFRLRNARVEEAVGRRIFKLGDPADRTLTRLGSRV